MEEGCGDTRLSTPQAFRLRVRRGEYLRMQEVYHEKLASAISTFEVERPQTRAFRSSAMGATLGQLPPSQQYNPDVALQAMRTQSRAIHAEYKRLHMQRQSVLSRKAAGSFALGGSLFARKISAVAPKLQAATAVRMMGRELGVKDRPLGSPRSLQRRASMAAVTASVRMNLAHLKATTTTTTTTTTTPQVPHARCRAERQWRWRWGGILDEAAAGRAPTVQTSNAPAQCATRNAAPRLSSPQRAPSLGPPQGWSLTEPGPWGACVRVRRVRCVTVWLVGSAVRVRKACLAK